MHRIARNLPSEVQVRNFHWFRITSVCLAFTGGGVAWADPPPDPPDLPNPPSLPNPVDQLVPKPAPNADYGSTARVGTSAGFIYGAPNPVIALGLQAAIGQRIGRLGFEAEYTYLGFQARGVYMSALGATDGDIGVGSGHRLAALARYDLVGFGPLVDRTRRSLLTIYVEGGAAVAWNHWTRPALSEPSRVVPDDTKRTEGQGGFGLMIFPHRVAWLLGWRFAVTPHQAMTGTACRGFSCAIVKMPDDNSLLDQSMLFQSSLEFTF